jgi:hypothetical protein
MGTAQVAFAVERWGGATGSHVTGSDANLVHCLEVCYAHAQPEVAQYPPEVTFELYPYTTNVSFTNYSFYFCL